MLTEAMEKNAFDEKNHATRQLLYSAFLRSSQCRSESTFNSTLFFLRAEFVLVKGEKGNYILMKDNFEKLKKFTEKEGE